MNLLVLVSTFVAMCAGSAIPLIPGDNSHYVEGKSRYIWMPDGEGNSHLVDLQAPIDVKFIETRNGNNNEYWLFTRQNRNNRQVVVNGNANSVRNSNYNGNRPTKVIVHGWMTNGNADWVPQMTAEFLNHADVNVFVLDWRRAASGLYTTSVIAVPGVGQHLANFLTFVFNTEGGNWNNVHLVGQSLGAHIVGNAGHHAPSLPSRVTGLDPAGPLWHLNSRALNRNSGVYVESIHTDGGILGIMDPVSHYSSTLTEAGILSLAAVTVTAPTLVPTYYFLRLSKLTILMEDSVQTWIKLVIINALAPILKWVTPTLVKEDLDYTHLPRAQVGLSEKTEMKETLKLYHSYNNIVHLKITSTFYF